MNRQIEEPTNDNLIVTSRSLRKDHPNNQNLYTTSKEFLDLLREVKIRFDTNPKFYQREDFQKLIELFLKISGTEPIIDLELVDQWQKIVKESTIPDGNLIKDTIEYIESRLGNLYSDGNGITFTHLQDDTVEISVDTSVIQEKLEAGDNIIITGNTISSSNTEYTAGNNISIVNNEISATDTTYHPGDGITIGEDNSINSNSNASLIQQIKVVENAPVDATGLWQNDIIPRGTSIQNILQKVFTDSGKNYIIPKEENKLIYSYNKKLESDYLIPEKYNIAVIGNEPDFIKSKGKGITEPDILSEFQQYSDSVYMPEYGKGRSYTQNNHLPKDPTIASDGSNSGIGYGKWYEDEGDINHKNKFICNPINSYEYTGYINPKKSSYFNYDVLIGTDKGNTTGDWSGYALINDDYAKPRYIVCSDGIKYYRNTLYDLTKVNGEKENPIGDSWCAWVNEHQDTNTAEVIYGRQVQVSGQTYYEDEFPSGEVSVYKILDISTKEARKTYSQFIYNIVTVESSHEASGFIAVMNIMTINSAGCNWDGVTYYNGTGTISISTHIIPCDPINFDPDDYPEPKFHKFTPGVLVMLANTPHQAILGTDLVPYVNELNSNNKYYGQSALPTKEYNLDCYALISVEEEFPENKNVGDFVLKGEKTLYQFNGESWIEISPIINQCALIPETAKFYQYHSGGWDGINNNWNHRVILLDINSKGVYYTATESGGTISKYELDPSTFNEFIRSNVLYDKGVLTLRFSNVIGGKNQNDVFNKEYLYKETINTNFPFNNSKIVIDFNNDTYTVTKYNGTTLQPIVLSSLPNYSRTYNIDGVDVDINMNDMFKNATKFMFMAQSQQNLLYKCTYFTYQENLILRADDNSVWQYNHITGQYDQIPNQKPVNYLSGSHLSFNDVTKKLWYSNGRDIYQVSDIVNEESQEIQDLKNQISELESRLDALENNT